MHGDLTTELLNAIEGTGALFDMVRWWVNESSAENSANTPIESTSNDGVGSSDTVSGSVGDGVAVDGPQAAEPPRNHVQLLVQSISLKCNDLCSGCGSADSSCPTLPVHSKIEVTPAHIATVRRLASDTLLNRGGADHSTLNGCGFR